MLLPLPKIAMHRGALAPKWVLETSEPLEESADDMSTYQRRLLSFLCGRFVCLSRPGLYGRDSLEGTNGIPEAGERYWWRYWDNERNVYQIRMEKWRRYQPAEGAAKPPHFGEVAGMAGEYALPGDFSTEKTWLRIHQASDMWGNSWGPIATVLSEFFENMWFWKYRGTTYISTWDTALQQLEASAGIARE